MSLRRGRNRTSAGRDDPGLVGAGTDGAYIIVLDERGNELGSCLYEGPWVLAGGFCTAYDVRTRIRRAGRPYSWAAYECRSGVLMGIAGIFGDPGPMRVGQTLVFPGGANGIRILPRWDEDNPQQQGALRALQGPIELPSALGGE